MDGKDCWRHPRSACCDATLTSLFGTMEEQEIDFDHRKSDGELMVKGAGSTVLLRSLEEPERLRGTNLAWFGIDELSYTREEAWLRLEARLRDPKAEKLAGVGVWTPQGLDWIYKRFLHDPVSGYGCVRAKAFENRHLLDRTPDYYQRLQSSYDPKFYRQEALGEYLNSRADRVYHCFNAAVHWLPSLRCKENFALGAGFQCGADEFRAAAGAERALGSHRSNRSGSSNDGGSRS